MTDVAVERPAPRFSVVTAVYNVSRYLPDFIRSIEAQSIDLAEIEVIAVDDGSTDDSLAVLRAWESRRPELVRVITKSNGRQASARNLGLQLVRGSWVTFIDPDDMVATDYFDRVAWAIDERPDVVMVAANRILYHDESDTLVDRHPLRKMFAHRDQFINLDKHPEYFYGSAPCAFLRMDILDKHDLRFDERIYPNFEDGHLCQRYLLRCSEPVVAFLKTARYHYRKRRDQTSTLQNATQSASRFFEVPTYGYLELLREASEMRGGRAPEWLQNIIIYELSYFLSPEDATWDTVSACQGEVAGRFLRILHDIRRELDEEVIRGFYMRWLRPEWRQILLYTLLGTDWHTPYAVIRKYDARRKQALVAYRFFGEEPDCKILLRGEPIEPAVSKTRAHVYWDHVLMRERLMWVPANGTLRVLLDDRLVPLRNDYTDFAATQVRPSALRARFERQRPTKKELDLSREALLRLAKSRPVSRTFKNAWVLIDHVNDAGDNAERLFQYLRKDHRKINAWFVISKDSPDYKRLKAEGYKRLVDYGSLRWKLLMLNAKHLISSHIDRPIVQPEALADLVRKPTWKFTFLQHGVIKDDLSGWLNPKNIDLFITSTPAEQQSIAGDDTRYVYTAREAKLTGLPRFDRLREIALGVSKDDQRTILITPTWRQWLSAPLQPGQTRPDVTADFGESEYAANWLGLLESSVLRDLCREHGVRVGFLPHPNMHAILKGLRLPDHVDGLSYDGQDVQKLFATAAVMVTDYSSTVFNAAYIDRPVVYFQFDQEMVQRGGHRGRKGYFDYERDGFGPVTTTVCGAERAIAAALASGRRTAEPYASRVAAAFPDRDGRCCARVVKEIKAL